MTGDSTRLVVGFMALLLGVDLVWLLLMLALARGWRWYNSTVHELFSYLAGMSLVVWIPVIIITVSYLVGDLIVRMVSHAS